MTRRSVPVRIVGAAATIAAAFLLGSCGVPIDAQPAALSRSGVPFNLLDPSTPTSTSTSTPSPIEVPVTIFLMGADGHVVPRQRDVPVSAPDLFTVMGALVLGPTDAEAASGLLSAIPAQTTVLGATISGGVATVNLGTTFGQLVGPPQIQAVAQVVFTASAVPGVTGVMFQLDGQPVEVPVASGAQVPVANTSQFTSLAPTTNPTPA
ncbi:MAG TPA: GerMN domain-containing protein [Acidimicrobiales bacterium]|nr:GerMN domain-containing protein [Acidimicrobiales bacterium]